MKHIDPTELNIINYLTGEMTVEEMRLFKVQLDKNLLLKEQVDEMRLAQGHLEKWNNDDIEIPEFQPLGNNEVKSEPILISPKTSKRIKLPNWMKYAAVLIGVGLLLQISGLKLNQNGNTLMLSFGEPDVESLDAKTVDEMVANAIQAYAKEQNGQLDEFKNQMSSEISNIANVVGDISSENKSNIAHLEGSFSRNMDKQFVNLESMIKGIEDNQRQDLEDSFTGLVEYIDNKRLQDQYKIQNAFSEIATAINDQQYQTNALLTSISDEDSGLKSY